MVRAAVRARCRVPWSGDVMELSVAAMQVRSGACGFWFLGAWATEVWCLFPW